MKPNQQRLYEIKEKPLIQCQRLFKWFAHIDVQAFDLQVRRYPNKQRIHESWITCHKDISGKRILDLWKWIRYENSHDADVYFRPHGPEDHPVIFLDDLTIEAACRVANAYSSAVVQTSDNNTQVWVKTSTPLSLNQRKQIQSRLRDLGYTDHGSVSGDHLGRLTGLFSQKRKTWVNVIAFSTPRAYDPLLYSPSPLHRAGGVCVLKGHAGDKSASEKDFGWAIGMFKSGMSYEKVYSNIAKSAKIRGKRNPEKYASLTARKSEITLKFE